MAPVSVTVRGKVPLRLLKLYFNRVDLAKGGQMVRHVRKGTTKIENNMSANGHWWSNVLNIISKNISAQTGFELTILKL